MIKTLILYNHVACVQKNTFDHLHTPSIIIGIHVNDNSRPGAPLRSVVWYKIFVSCAWLAAE